MKKTKKYEIIDTINEVSWTIFNKFKKIRIFLHK